MFGLLFNQGETVKKRFDVPYLGFGLGLRTTHYRDFLNSKPENVDWLEIISETFLLDGGRPLHYLEQFKEKYRLVPHGVSLSIGSVDPLDWNYLERLKKLIQKINAPWFSDHICWTKVHGKNMHNLMPLPYTDEVVNFIADKIRAVQDFMGIPFIFENVSSYIEFSSSQMPEWEFVAKLAEKADCGILLDVNNVFVSSFNHSFDPMTYMKHMPADRVLQYHIAGHKDKGDYILDTHDHDIRDEVWDLYTKTAPLFQDVSLLLERDDHIPPLKDLLKELDYARKIHAKTLAAA